MVNEQPYARQLANIIFGETFQLKGIIREDYNFSSQVTDHTVQGGSDLQDHITNDPETLTIEGYLITFGKVDGLLRNAVDFFGSETRPPLRPDEALDILTRIWRSRDVINITSTLRKYKDMAITNISLPNDFANANNPKVTITLQKLNILEVERVGIDDAPDRAGRSFLGDLSSVVLYPVDLATDAGGAIVEGLGAVVGTVRAARNLFPGGTDEEDN